MEDINSKVQNILNILSSELTKDEIKFVNQTIFSWSVYNIDDDTIIKPDNVIYDEKCSFSYNIMLNDKKTLLKYILNVYSNSFGYFVTPFRIAQYLKEIKIIKTLIRQTEQDKDQLDKKFLTFLILEAENFNLPNSDIKLLMPDIKDCFIGDF